MSDEIAQMTLHSFASTERAFWKTVVIDKDNVLRYREPARRLSEYFDINISNFGDNRRCPLDVTCETSQNGRHLSLLAPEGYKVQRDILIRLQEDEDGTHIVTSTISIMYGHGQTPEDAFEDFRTSLASYFLSLVRDKDILSVLPQRELKKLSKVFVEDDS